MYLPLVNLTDPIVSYPPEEYSLYGRYLSLHKTMRLSPLSFNFISLIFCVSLSIDCFNNSD